MKTPNVRPIRSAIAMTIEDFILTTLLYAVFVLFCLKLIGFGILLTLTIVYVVRVFTIRHEKSHNGIKNYKGFMGILTNYYTIFHSPYQEPYAEKKRKHILHHRSHTKSYAFKSDAENPHQVLEDGPWYKALVKCFFYEELMFWLDLKFYKRITRDRLKMMTVSMLGILALVKLAGPSNFLFLVLSYRMGMGLVWFFFSFVLHSEPYYSHSSEIFHRMTPHWLLKGTELLFGSSNATVVVFHRFHHDNPNKFYKF